MDMNFDYHHPEDFDLVAALTGAAVRTRDGRKVLAIFPHGAHLAVMVERSPRLRQYGCNGMPMNHDAGLEAWLVTANDQAQGEAQGSSRLSPGATGSAATIPEAP